METKYKIQEFDKKNIAFLDIQKSFQTLEEAKDSIKSGVVSRVIEITGKNRKNIYTRKEDGSSCEHPQSRLYVFKNSNGITKRTCCTMCQDQLLWG